MVIDDARLHALVANMDSTMVFGTCSTICAYNSICYRKSENSSTKSALSQKKHLFLGTPLMVPRSLKINLIVNSNFICSRGVMDSTMVFGTISSGSNPDGSTNYNKKVD